MIEPATLDVETLPLQGRHLIEASAGTGKTHAIATLFSRLVVEAKCGVEEILVMTFTNKATAELRERIRRRLIEDRRACEARVVADDPRDARDRLARTIEEFDRVSVFTLHGFCQRVLIEHAYASGLDLDSRLEGNLSELSEELIADYWQQVSEVSDPMRWRTFERSVKARGKAADSELARLLSFVETHGPVPMLPEISEAGDGAWVGKYADARAALKDWWTARRADLQARWQEVGVPWPEDKRRTKLDPSTIRRLFDVVLRDETPGALGRGLIDRATGNRLTGVTRALHEREGEERELANLWDAAWRAEDRAVAVLEAERIQRLQEFVAGARTEAVRRRERHGLLSFNDLLHRLARVLDSDRGSRLADELRKRYRAILIDEFQDTDPIQYRIVSSLYRESEGCVFLIGDPKQSIYRFRGADVAAYLKASREAHHVHTLQVNWRSDPSFVRAIDSVFGRAPSNFFGENITFSGARAAPAASDVLWTCKGLASGLDILFGSSDKKSVSRSSAETIPDAEEESARLVARDVRSFMQTAPTIAGRPVSLSDIAILVRRNEDGRDLVKVLGEHGLRCVLHSVENVFLSDDAATLVLLMETLLVPPRRDIARRLLASRLFGFTAQRLVDLDADDARWDVWIRCFDAWRVCWVEHGFGKTLSTILAATVDGATCSVQARMLQEANGVARVTNIRHLMELLHEAEQARRLHPAGLLRWLCSAIDEPDMDDENACVRAASKSDAITVMTIHKSKGLEFPIVYLPTLWRVRNERVQSEGFFGFHDPTDAHRLKLAFVSDATKPFMEHATRESHAEEARLVYVAMTRAKHRCVLVWGHFKNVEQSPLYRVLHAEHERLREHEDARNTDAEGAMQRELLTLAEKSEGAIRLHVESDVAGEAVASFGMATNPQAGDPALLQPRTSHRNIDSTFGVTSYSGLIRSRTELVMDGDESDGAPQENQPRAKRDDSIPLAEFPHGATAGSCLHAIFERVPFLRASVAAISPTVTKTLRSFSFDDRKWTLTVARAIVDVLGTPLGGAFRLCDVPDACRRSEMPFFLTASRRSGSTVTPDRLAHAFRTLGDREDLREYHSKVASLAFGEFHGFLKGTIDLVVEVDGRTYVVDYKSNFLGDRYSDYHADAILQEMIHHHYILQYYLYGVALQRYLMARRADYDFDRHFGGAFFLFVRGMHPEKGPSHGVFYDRMSKPCLFELDALFGGANVETSA